MPGGLNEPRIYNLDQKKYIEYDGHSGYASIITAKANCTTAADTIATITADYKGYVTFMSLYNSNAAAQTFELLENTSTRLLFMNIGAGETVIINADKEPLFEIAEGLLKGDAETGNHIVVTITYYEKLA